MKHKILLIEDDEKLSKILTKGLIEADFEVINAYDGDFGLKLALQDSSINLIITDVILPKKDGLQLCSLIKEQSPKLPIIMLTALGTTDDKLVGFDAGADDYLTKPFEIRELIARIKVLLKRYSANHNSLQNTIVYDDIILKKDEKSVFRNGNEIILTPKEFKLFSYMLEHRERVLSRSEIAENVWETHFDTGTNFIDVYINYIRKKIDKNFDSKLIHTKPGMGFILKKEQND